MVNYRRETAGGAEEVSRGGERRIKGN